MAGADYTIAFKGEQEVERQLTGIIGRLENPEPLLDILGQVIESDIDDNFDGEHTPAGIPWLPVFRPEGDNRKILHGKPPRLRPSMNREVGRSYVRVGTNVIYARRQNDGFTGTEQVSAHRRIMSVVFGVRLQSPMEVMVRAHSRQANTPAREFLGVSPGAQEDMIGMAGDYVAGEAA
ncbi:phage virion morphogenesis protein [Sphingomonas sp. AOB5]|uniref:phage virion morphogenesis protein n=1 Tax=Sphingomonas sp. AOB5 TaxID=3034017 RepID=UPI0023F9A686|nr:phage virion morphogenesis protein [Sphingomonas sp. AOB5]MDF7776873.1 phage virion morphogenesis protein [Sphingomonas sp. AOB5]